MNTLSTLLAAAFACVSIQALAQTSTTPDKMTIGFKSVPGDAKLRMFWRVFGPAWSREEIDFQFDTLQKAGVGGVMTCFTYPVTIDDPTHNIKNDEFMSPTFREMLGYAAQSAKHHNIKFGICGGTGWPFGGPTVSLADSAQRIRQETLRRSSTGSYPLPKLKQGEHLLSLFKGSTNITNTIKPGADSFAASEADSSPYNAYIVGPTYMRVKRAALGAEGYVLDHYSREATQRYLDAVVGPMLDSAPHGLIHSLFCDSLEVYNGNWTPELPSEFRKRRGYDLLPLLPLLFDEKNVESHKLRFDFWRTLAELAEDRFADTVHKFCKARGVDFVLEAYGTPPMGFTAAAKCDVPWGEQYEWKGFSFSRFAASGAHLAGKNIIGAEAWTWTGIPNRLADTLSDLKLCSDLHFLAGENELTGVDYPYSPRSIGAPGWSPYYGPVINWNNPQWHCFPDLAAYTSRCQWMLRQGKPVADVAIYVPTEDSFAEGPTNQMPLDFQIRDRMATGELTGEFGLENARKHHSNTIQTLISNGYNFDGIDLFALKSLVTVQSGKLHGKSSDYSIVILPDLHGIELNAMRKIADLCRSGGAVIALKSLPKICYGDRSSDADARLRSLIDGMFAPLTADSPYSSKVYGKGMAIFAANDDEALRAALRSMTGSKGFDVFHRTYPSAVLTHVHRRTENRDIFFMANVGERPIYEEVMFRTKHVRASIWDPMTGVITPVGSEPGFDGYMMVPLSLPARGSQFVCFEEGDAIPIAQANKSKETTQILDGKWHVSFNGPDAPEPRDVMALTSWVGWPGARYFSGLATYTTHVKLDAGLPAKQVLLGFTQVRETARIRINGREAGSVWNYPYEIDIAPFLKPGANELEITVGNLQVNRVLGLPDPDLASLRAVFGERFPAPEEKGLMKEPAPSGLIGPVKLIVVH